jgi:hypothetical protein
MTKLTAIAIPILQGKTEQWKKFAGELNTNYKKEYLESRKKLGIYERTFLQSNPGGDMVIVTFEGENPGEVMKKFSEQSDEFSKWFVAQVKEIHGLDLTQKDASPPQPELVIESEPIEEHVHE